MVINTMKMVDVLRAANFKPEQAQAIARVVADTWEESSEELSTKKDLEVLEANLKADLIKWMVNIGIVQTGVILGLVYFMLNYSR